MKWRGLIAEAKIAFPRRDPLTVTLTALVRNAFQLHLPDFDTFAFSSRTPQKSICDCPRTRGFRQKAPQFGRSSDNRRFCSPNYSAWRRSRTESLLSNARYFINSPPCARFARALGAPRTAHFATPPLGAGAALVTALFSGPMDQPLLRCAVC